MQGEFNDLTYNNTNITFSTATNNIATSDELSASPIYQEKMGTNFSRAKKVGKAVNIVGLSVIFTATAFASGSILSNIFIVNPPTVSVEKFEIEANTISFSFAIKNTQNYKTTYYIVLEGDVVEKVDCSETGEYSNSYVADVNKATNGNFYISFTNSFDYRKTIFTKSFTIGGN